MNGGSLFINRGCFLSVRLSGLMNGLLTRVKTKAVSKAVKQTWTHSELYSLNPWTCTSRNNEKKNKFNMTLQVFPLVFSFFHIDHLNPSAFDVLKVNMKCFDNVDNCPIDQLLDVISSWWSLCYKTEAFPLFSQCFTSWAQKNNTGNRKKHDPHKHSSKFSAGDINF